MTAAIERYTPDERQVIELLGLKADQAHTKALLLLAERYELDPVNKEIVLVPGRGPFVGVWGRLHIAHRSGLFDGLEADDEWEDDLHYKIRVVVYRKDMSHAAARVIGRVAKTEKKEWPLEIARARGVRAALGFAFNIHDAYDTGDEDGGAPPDERITADGTVIDIIHQQEPRQEEPESLSTGEVPRTAPPAGQQPRTIVVGGHSLPEKLAIAAKAAGLITDDERHDVIRAATSGKARTGHDVTDDQAPRILDAFNGLADGTVELRYEPDGTPKLYKVRKASR